MGIVHFKSNDNQGIRESNHEKIDPNTINKKLDKLKSVAYDIFESSTRPDVLMICETWKDADALSIHEQTAHFVSYVGKMKELSEMKLEKFNF